MKIVVIGTRGIPDIPGGVETHCQELYPRLAAMGHDVTVIRRTPYLRPGMPQGQWHGVKLIDVKAPCSMAFETPLHSLRAVFAARRLHPDILHIHGIGPSIVAPLARLMGMRVVMTYHSPNYEHEKWGWTARTVLRLGESLASRCARRVICISQPIQQMLQHKYPRRNNTTLIYNGVNPPMPLPDDEPTGIPGLLPRRYVLGVGRLVPEKNFHHLIEAFAQAAPEGYRLVIAGDADHPTPYSDELKALARKHGVIMPGYITGLPLQRLLHHAALFVLPSSHEGLPISLLEAMSHHLDVLVSDIPANHLPETDPQTDFFTVGDIPGLAAAIQRKLLSPSTPRTYDLSAYDWQHIASQTAELYARVYSL